jgi:hypothetical protein
MSAAEKKKPVDLAIVFGGGGSKKGRASEDDSADDSYEDDDEDSDVSDVSAEFESAYDEWKADPSPDTMWRMIKACVGGD